MESTMDPGWTPAGELVKAELEVGVAVRYLRRGVKMEAAREISRAIARLTAAQGRLLHELAEEGRDEQGRWPANREEK